MQESARKETSHIPAFRLRVARRWHDYRRRLAERIEHERTKQSLSREALALKAGISEKTIKRIEERKVDNPRPVTIRRIADALDVAPAQLRPPVEFETDQLDRIEDMLKLLLVHFKVDLPDDPGEAAERAAATFLQEKRQEPPPSEAEPDEGTQADAGT